MSQDQDFSIETHIPEFNSSEWRILLVDDVSDNLKVLRQMLEPEGYRILFAQSGKLALQIAQRATPDLILLDILMPGIDGFETCQRLKDHHVTAHIPVLFITAEKKEPEDVVRGFRVGGVDYITKPFHREEALARVETHLKISQLTRELRDKNRELQREVGRREQVEKQMLQQQRLRVVGQMSAGIAHNINNALMPILGYTELLLNSEEAFTEKTKQYLRTMNVSASDIAATVRGLSELYSDPSLTNSNLTTVDSNEIIQQTIVLTRSKWQDEGLCRNISITVETNLGSVPPVTANPAELRSALTNMIFNAVEAMPDGGVLSFQTYVNDGYLILKVADTGTGMSEQTRQRCFDPFFTTKFERGSGLGLATVYQSVARHKGEISVESQLGEGTTFTIRLPVAPRIPTVDSQPEQKRPEPTQCSLHVLVVEDESSVQQLLIAYLRQLGHTVETANDGQEGLARFKESQFDLVITDQAMPQMNGNQLAEAIRECQPSIPILMLTGFLEMQQANNQISPKADSVVTKPVTFQEFKSALAKLTGRYKPTEPLPSTP